MRTRVASLLLLVMGIVFVGGPARAGGGQWAFEGHKNAGTPVFVQGDSVRAHTGLWMKGVKGDGRGDLFWAGPEQGPFFGYLVSEAQHSTKSDYFPPPVPQGAIPVGEVAFSEVDGGAVRASLDFVMPDVPPGAYLLIHCNDPCDRQIGDLMTTPITVVGDEGQAFLAAKLDRLERRTFNLRYALKYRLRSAVRSVERRFDPIVERLEARIAVLEERPDPRPVRATAVPTTSLLLAALVGAAAAYWIPRRKSVA